MRNILMHRALLGAMAVFFAVPAWAHRYGTEGRCALRLALLEGAPSPEDLSYGFVLDLPFDPVSEGSGDEERDRSFRDLVNHWRFDPPAVEGALVDRLDYLAQLSRLAPHWFRRARGYVRSREDWGFDQRRRALEEFCAIIQERVRVPSGWFRPWRISAHRSKEGHLVLTGTEHRLVLLNDRVGSLWTGRIPFRERGWIDRVGGPTRYYRNWVVRDLDDLGLRPVAKEPFWDESILSPALPSF